VKLMRRPRLCWKLWGCVRRAAILAGNHPAEKRSRVAFACD
jgi:hypothetical protein